MISVIVCGHGEFSTGLLSATDMIFGDQEEFVAVPFLKGEGTQNLQKKFYDVMEGFSDNNEILFLVDIFGGSPYNAASQIAISDENINVAAGVNLPILLETLSLRGNLSLDKLLQNLKLISQDSFQILSEHITKTQENNNDDEGELL